jgi:hypothetical protein
VAFLYRLTDLTEVGVKAQEQLEKVFNDIEWEIETGLPAIAKQFPPADARPG